MPCATFEAAFIVIFGGMDFTQLASAKQDLFWQCSTRAKCHEAKAAHYEMTIVNLGSAADAQMI